MSAASQVMQFSARKSVLMPDLKLQNIRANDIKTDDKVRALVTKIQ